MCLDRAELLVGAKSNFRKKIKKKDERKDIRNQSRLSKQNLHKDFLKNRQQLFENYIKTAQRLFRNYLKDAHDKIHKIY